MTMGFLKKLFASDEDQQERQYEPLYSGPPENPEYYVLAVKKGAKFPHSKEPILTYKIPNLARDQELLRLRKERYLASHPERKETMKQIGDPYNKHGEPLLEAHMPTFDVYKKDVTLKYYPVQPVYSQVFEMWPYQLVPLEWKVAIEQVAPGECQFFPYEYRLRDGTVIYKRYILKCLAPRPSHVFDGVKSGFRRQYLPPAGMVWNRGGIDGFHNRIWGGQLVMYRAAMANWNIMFNGDQYFVSAKLCAALRPHCGDYADFYPVHLDDEG
jgi:hypothetical protein